MGDKYLLERFGISEDRCYVVIGVADGRGVRLSMQLVPHAASWIENNDIGGVPCFKSRTLFQFAFTLIDDQELSLAKSKEALNPTTARVVTSMVNVNHKKRKIEGGRIW